MLDNKAKRHHFSFLTSTSLINSTHFLARTDRRHLCSNNEHLDDDEST